MKAPIAIARPRTATSSIPAIARLTAMAESQAAARASRIFEPREFEPGNDRVAVLSHELFRSAFGADPDVIGET